MATPKSNEECALDVTLRRRKGSLFLRNLYKTYLNFYVSFFDRYPALRIGFIFTLISFAFFANATALLLIPLTFPRLTSLLWGFFFFLFIASTEAKIPSSIHEIKGTATLEITHLKEYQKGNKTLYLAKGSIKTFSPSQDSTSLYQNIPCFLRLKLNRENALENIGTIVAFGTLTKSPYGWSFFEEKRLSFSPKPFRKHLLSFSHLFWKKARIFFSSTSLHQEGLELLMGLLSGDCQLKFLKIQLGECGLQHLLVISGFHFSLLALFVYFLFSKLFFQKLALVLCFFVITFYFLILPTSPSLQRAYLTISCYLVARFFNKIPVSLNLFGVALLGVLLLRPSAVLDLSFQLSFMATWAILIGFNPLKRALALLFKTRRFCFLKEQPIETKLAYLALQTFKDTLALTFIVQLFVTPVLIVFFQTFSTLGLFYNLFYPLLISISLTLFLLCLPLLLLSFAWIKSLFVWIYSLFDLLAQIPLSKPFFLRGEVTFSCSSSVASLLLVLLFFLFITLHQKNTSQEIPLFF